MGLKLGGLAALSRGNDVYDYFFPGTGREILLMQSQSQLQQTDFFW